MAPIFYLATLLGLGAFVAHKIGHTQTQAPGASALPPTPPQGQRLVTLDATLPDADLQATIHAVLYEKDPVRLDALAGVMQQRGFRCAGFELQYRAWELRGASGPPPARPTSCGESKQAPGVNIPGVTEEIAAEACRLIDPTLDGSTCAAVLTALGTDPDPANLETFAGSLDPTHPRAAAALRQKAAILRGVTAPPAAPPYIQEADPPPQAPPLATDPAQQTPPIMVQQAPPPIVQQPPLHLAPTAQPPQPIQHLAPTGTQAAHYAPPLAHAGGAVPNVVAEGAPGVPFTAAEAAYAPMEPEIAQAASLSPKLEGTVHHSEGSGNPPSLAQAAVAQAAGTLDASHAAAAAPQGGSPSGAAGFPVVAQTARGAERPRGHWFLHIRAGDTPWPMTVAKLGAMKKDPAALAELFAMNPHLWTAPGSGVIASFQPGDEVNIPGAWSNALITKGFKVKRD